MWGSPTSNWFAINLGPPLNVLKQWRSKCIGRSVRLNLQHKLLSLSGASGLRSVLPLSRAKLRYGIVGETFSLRPFDRASDRAVPPANFEPSARGINSIAAITTAAL